MVSHRFYPHFCEKLQSFTKPEQLGSLSPQSRIYGGEVVPTWWLHWSNARTPAKSKIGCSVYQWTSSGERTSKENLNMPKSTQRGKIASFKNLKLLDLIIGFSKWMALPKASTLKSLENSWNISGHLGFSVKKMNSQTIVEHVPALQLPGKISIPPFQKNSVSKPSTAREFIASDHVLNMLRTGKSPTFFTTIQLNGPVFP